MPLLKAEKESAEKNSKREMVSFGDDEEVQKKDGINSADALSKVNFKQNDIVKKPGVSIWKIINVRYKKSAWRSLLKKRNKDKK